MMTRRTIVSALAVTLLAAFTLTACMGNSGTPATPAKVSQKEKAREAANSVVFNENAEIDNIKKRLELTSQPGLLGFVTLINKVGQTVMYTPVKGKITSGGKRLTAPQKIVTSGNGNGGTNMAVTEDSSDEGTYGHSNDYIFFWTPGGQYFQTSLDFVYSDKPYRLREQPLIDLGEVAPVVPATPAPSK